MYILKDYKEVSNLSVIDKKKFTLFFLEYVEIYEGFLYYSGDKRSVWVAPGECFYKFPGETQIMSNSFSQFAFNEVLLKAIEKTGYATPTSIQNDVIPSILAGKDVIAKSQTGTGKTAAFCLPALQLLIDNPDKTILILAPTRELALQVCNEMQLFSTYFGITPTAIYGGEAMSRQLHRLKEDSRIIVGTPGRLLDLYRSKYLKNFHPQLVVLDEADEMLNMGFLEDIQSIFSFVPEVRQTLLFSATISPQIKKISRQFLQDPLMFEQAGTRHNHDIDQLCYLVSDRQRKLALLHLIKFHSPTKSIVFCNTKRQVEELSSELSNLGLSVLCLHGDMTQRDRLHSIDTFRKSPSKILIATDVAGRGIHVNDISHVFNYEIPNSMDGYTHRIGRTGRMGNKGIAITLVAPKEMNSFRRLLDPKSKQVQFSPLPSFEEIKLQQNKKYTESIKQRDIHVEAKQILSLIQEECSLEEIALKLISEHLEKEAALSVEKLYSPQPEVRERRERRREKDFGHRKSRPPRRFQKKSFRK